MIRFEKAERCGILKRDPTQKLDHWDRVMAKKYTRFLTGNGIELGAGKVILK